MFLSLARVGETCVSLRTESRACTLGQRRASIFDPSSGGSDERAVRRGRQSRTARGEAGPTTREERREATGRMERAGGLRLLEEVPAVGISWTCGVQARDQRASEPTTRRRTRRLHQPPPGIVTRMGRNRGPGGFGGEDTRRAIEPGPTRSGGGGRAQSMAAVDPKQPLDGSSSDFRFAPHFSRGPGDGPGSKADIHEVEQVGPFAPGPRIHLHMKTGPSRHNLC